MPAIDEAYARLSRIQQLKVTRNEPLARHARFAFGGPAAIFADTEDEGAFIKALKAAPKCGLPWTVIGGGTNLIVSDAGYRGIVLRYRGAAIWQHGSRITVQAGAVLQDLVDFSIAAGLKGLETMTGIPGYVGAAVYGNAGAYGRSMSDMVTSVRYFDGARIREADFDACEFRYRTSKFKRHKHWFILSAELKMSPGDPDELDKTAEEIQGIRDRKYPPSMACAGSIFKNRILAELPEAARAAVPPGIVKGGKVPSAWFLEQAGAKGLANGGIRVTDYHANTLFNAGGGTAAQFVELVRELKRRVRERFGFELEEEVQYVGFDETLPGLDQLKATPAIIQSLLAVLSPEDLRWRPGAGRWSICDVLAHLAEIDRETMLPRARRVIEEDTPAVSAFEPGDDPPAEPAFALAALEDFLAARRESLAFLEGVPAAALGRTALHSEAGAVTLRQILNHWAFHDLGHIRQIAELVRARGYLPEMGPLRAGYTVKP